MTLHELQRRLNGFDIRDELKDAVIETAGDIITLQQGQFSLGKRSDGTEITPSYSDYTIELKEEKGQETRWVTLRDTGSFWDLTFVDVGDNWYEISSADSKTAKLEKKYGKKIFGLTKESRSEEYIPLSLLPALQERITSKLGFKFG